VILISGYADFTYAQTAIECGAIAYCLKPLQDKDIQNALIRAARTLAKPADLTASFWETVDQPENAALSLSSYFSESDLNHNISAPCLVYYVIGQGNSPLSAFPHLKLSAGKKRHLYLCSSHHASAIQKNLFSWSSHTFDFSIGYGGRAATVGELSSAIQLAKEMPILSL
jgi:two-component system response regulator YesN